LRYPVQAVEKYRPVVKPDGVASGAIADLCLPPTASHRCGVEWKKYRETREGLFLCAPLPIGGDGGGSMVHSWCT
jgi:hypothetical protein